MLVIIWYFDIVLVRPFPISRLDFGYYTDALPEHLGNPPKKTPATPIYRSPWRTKQPGWDTIILDPSKISMIVDDFFIPLY